MLEKGVEHYSSTVYPRGNEPKFKYEMREAEIVGGGEVLTLSTCYPCSYLVLSVTLMRTLWINNINTIIAPFGFRIVKNVDVVYSPELNVHPG